MYITCINIYAYILGLAKPPSTRLVNCFGEHALYFRVNPVVHSQPD